jgi:hypothetical protein
MAEGPSSSAVTFSLHSSSSRGTTNASVFPLPVLAWVGCRFYPFYFVSHEKEMEKKEKGKKEQDR